MAPDSSSAAHSWRALRSAWPRVSGTSGSPRRSTMLGAACRCAPEFEENPNRRSRVRTNVRDRSHRSRCPWRKYGRRMTRPLDHVVPGSSAGRTPDERSGSCRSEGALARKPHLVSLRQPGSEGDSVANVRLFEVRKIGKQLFDGPAGESASTIMPTVTRMPRMHGLPPMISGAIVMRLNCCTLVMTANQAGRWKNDARLAPWEFGGR